MSLVNKCIAIAKESAIFESDTILSPIENTVLNITELSSKARNCGYIFTRLNTFFYISDLHLTHKVAHKFKNGAPDFLVKNYVKQLARDLFSDELNTSIKSLEYPAILFCGDISTDFSLAAIFYEEFVMYWKKVNPFSDKEKDLHIYAVLGNHEFWEFGTVDECLAAYQNLFDKLGIQFLNNSFQWYDGYHVPHKKLHDKKGNFIGFGKIDPDDEPQEYLDSLQHMRNVLLVGGVGFSAQNPQFNATTGMYRTTVDAQTEIEQTNAWNECYENALSIAKQTNSLLICITHNPLNDWKTNSQLDKNCVYFYGHNHQNTLYNDPESNATIFADNQIGYHNFDIKLKKTVIEKRINPFAGYADGYHEVSVHDYLLFCDYKFEKIGGTKRINKTLERENAHLYLVKHNDYHGFFITTNANTYICAGGNINVIGKKISIEHINATFERIIQSYIDVLSPYRSKQEKISRYVKSFGGSGRIHGTIIDIDFFNHIMLNPHDGKITYYYSLFFGLATIYDSLEPLLKNHCDNLLENYRKLLNSGAKELMVSSPNQAVGQTVKIDIKNSIYSTSRNLNQAQRLFDNGILRMWDETILDVVPSLNAGEDK